MGNIHAQVQNFNRQDASTAIQSCYGGNGGQLALIGEMRQAVKSKGATPKDLQMFDLHMQHNVNKGNPVRIGEADVTRQNVGAFCAAAAGRAEELGALDAFVTEKLELKPFLSSAQVKQALTAFLDPVFHNHEVGEITATVPGEYSRHNIDRTRYLNEHEAHFFAAAAGYKEGASIPPSDPGRLAQATGFGNLSYDLMPNVKLKNAALAGVEQGVEAYHAAHGLESGVIEDDFLAPKKTGFQR